MSAEIGIENSTQLFLIIDAERHERGWSRRKLCAEAGVNRNSLYNWDARDNEPSFTTAVKLAKALGLRIRVVYDS